LVALLQKSVQLHRPARLPLGPAGFRPDFARSDFGAGFASPSDEESFKLFFEFCPAFAARSATCAWSPATTARSPQPRGPLHQQLPQPRVQHAQLGSGITRRIRHEPHYP
jgi:hypothetical protein